MKTITMQKSGLDTNGNMTYLYNFVDDESHKEQKEINSMFKYFGRLSNKGIKNQYDAKTMKEWISQFGIWLNMGVGVDLGKAQKVIDRCNSKSGCNAYCSADAQSKCSKIIAHSESMDELSYIHEFLGAEIIEIEA